MQLTPQFVSVECPDDFCFVLGANMKFYRQNNLFLDYMIIYIRTNRYDAIFLFLHCRIPILSVS